MWLVCCLDPPGQLLLLLISLSCSYWLLSLVLSFVETEQQLIYPHMLWSSHPRDTLSFQEYKFYLGDESLIMQCERLELEN